MLSTQVIAIPATTITDINGMSVTMQFNCHQATCYWIYQELHGAAPMGWSFTDTQLDNTTLLITEMAKHGKLAQQSNINMLPNGTVLIFTDPMGQAMHSCILDGTGQIGGYNQQSWFTSPGIPNQFTQHARGHIRWRNGKNNKVLLSNGSKGRLVYVDETTALQFAKFKF